MKEKQTGKMVLAVLFLILFSFGLSLSQTPPTPKPWRQTRLTFSHFTLQMLGNIIRVWILLQITNLLAIYPQSQCPQPKIPNGQLFTQMAQSLSQPILSQCFTAPKRQAWLPMNPKWS